MEKKMGTRPVSPPFPLFRLSFILDSFMHDPVALLYPSCSPFFLSFFSIHPATPFSSKLMLHALSSDLWHKKQPCFMRSHIDLRLISKMRFWRDRMLDAHKMQNVAAFCCSYSVTARVIILLRRLQQVYPHFRLSFSPHLSSFLL